MREGKEPKESSISGVSQYIPKRSLKIVSFSEPFEWGFERGRRARPLQLGAVMGERHANLLFQYPVHNLCNYCRRGHGIRMPAEVDSHLELTIIQVRGVDEGVLIDVAGQTVAANYGEV